VILLLAVALALGIEEPQVRVERQEPQLAGPSEWILERGELDGNKFTAEGELTLGRKDDGYLSVEPLAHWNLVFSQKLADGQRQIDLSLWDIHSACPQSALGIYRIRSDRLTLCFSFHGHARPAEFVTKPDDDRVLLIFKRKK